MINQNKWGNLKFVQFLTSHMHSENTYIPSFGSLLLLLLLIFYFHHLFLPSFFHHRFKWYLTLCILFFIYFLWNQIIFNGLVKIIIRNGAHLKAAQWNAHMGITMIFPQSITFRKHLLQMICRISNETVCTGHGGQSVYLL